MCDISVYDIGDIQDAGAGPEFAVRSTPVARKEHKCCECRRVIKKGERYTREKGKWETFHVYKTCIDCTSIRDAFFQNGYMYERVLSDVREEINNLGGDVPESCMLQLTPAAFDKVAVMIEED